MASTDSNQPTREPFLSATIVDPPSSNNQGSSTKNGKYFKYRWYFIGLSIIVAILIGIGCYFALSPSKTPVLIFKPTPANSKSRLISFSGGNQTTWDYWFNSLKLFTIRYKHPELLPGRGARVKICDYENPPNKGDVCYYDYTAWGACSEESFFGFYRVAPCIFLQSNEILGWRPQFYNDTMNLPEEMPQQLQERIKDIGRRNPSALNNVWVSCEGETSADKENIGPIKYFPQPGFPGYYYPYENTEGYLSPVIAIQFQRPQLGVLISVECKAWAKDIQNEESDKLGSVHFELLID